LLPSNDDLFLVVFFLNLPNYKYGPGELDGKPYPARTFRNSGLLDQYYRVERCLGIPSDWLVDKPFVQNMTVPPQDVLQTVHRWCGCFSPPFDFDPDVHLKEAIVGIALWQIPG